MSLLRSLCLLASFQQFGLLRADLGRIYLGLDMRAAKQGRENPVTHPEKKYVDCLDRKSDSFSE